MKTAYISNVRIPRALVLDEALSDAGKLALCYIYAAIERTGINNVQIRLWDFVNVCGFSDKAHACRIVGELVRKGYIQKEERFDPVTLLKTACVYSITNYKKPRNKYVLLSTKYFKLAPKCFTLMLYYLSKEWSGEAQPSYADTAKDVGLSPATVAKYNALLTQQGVIFRQKYVRGAKGGYGHNHYYIVHRLIRRLGGKLSTLVQRFVQLCKLTRARLKIVQSVLKGENTYVSLLAGIDTTPAEERPSVINTPDIIIPAAAHDVRRSSLWMSIRLKLQLLLCFFSDAFQNIQRLL